MPARRRHMGESGFLSSTRAGLCLVMPPQRMFLGTPSSWSPSDSPYLVLSLSLVAGAVIIDCMHQISPSQVHAGGGGMAANPRLQGAKGPEQCTMHDRGLWKGPVPKHNLRVPTQNPIPVQEPVGLSGRGAAAWWAVVSPGGAWKPAGGTWDSGFDFGLGKNTGYILMRMIST